MLRRLHESFRIRATILLAAAYAVCVLAPAAALAFADGQAHCLNGNHGLAAQHEHGGQAHTHADGSSHVHHDDGVTDSKHSDSGKADSGQCCGVFCMSALATESIVSLGRPSEAAPVFPAIDTGVAGLSPDRINRPPIV